jgi:hypothetical protein
LTGKKFINDPAGTASQSDPRGDLKVAAEREDESSNAQQRRALHVAEPGETQTLASLNRVSPLKLFFFTSSSSAQRPSP